MKTLRLLLYLLLISNISAAQNVWPAQTKEMKPWTRWWWIGSAVNEKDISTSLHTYQQAGFGGVEIAPIYGAIGYEQQYISYLSPRWVQMLGYTTSSAAKLGMGVDLTTGTGWPFGGPQITPEYAASKKTIRHFTVKAGEKISSIPTDNLQALTAYNGDKILHLENNLQWSPADGTWEVYALYLDKTKQMVKRAAPGGEGFTLDHFSREGLNLYLHRFDTALHNNPHGIRAFYNDSYEVYNADWSAAFFDEFKKRKGYSLQDHLAAFNADSSDYTARVKSDYRETMSDMLLNNFTRPWTAWSHSYKRVTKNQAHGSPGNLLDLYAAVDIPECETYGSTYFPIPGLRRDSADVRNVDPDPVMLKFASSAAHVSGHPLVSCETFTWLTEHFKTSLSQCKPEVEQAFLAGVNHVFFHGTTYSPQDVAWPGWLFYASVNFVPSNSWWSQLPGLTNYIARVQSVLQTSQPTNELLIYWPVYDIWHNPKGKDFSLKVHDIDEWLYPGAFYKQVTGLQKAGYSLDFISDALLDHAVVENGLIRTAAHAVPYKALIIPAAKMIPVATLRKILQLKKQGATVIFESKPEDVPGLHNLEERRKELQQLLPEITVSPDIQTALTQHHINRETLTDAGLKFIRLKSGADTYYYLVNHTPNKIDDFIHLNTSSAYVFLMDPLNGSYGKAIQNKDGVKIQLLPGESIIVKVLHQAIKAASWGYLDNPQAPLTLTGNWLLTFPTGGPFKPAATQLKQPVLWTSLPDTAAQSFSGTGVYQLTFNLPEKNASEYILEPGELHESAKVFINGKGAGICWSIPSRLRIGKYLQKGKNEIKIEVANLMANRIRYMDQHKIAWRRYHEINFVNINYTAFDASGWQVQPSGLAGPVKIIAYK